MVKMAVNNGTSHIFCTPHVYPDVYDNNADSIKRARDELKNKVSNGVKLFFGGDVRIMPDLVERLAKQEVPTLNGSPYLLVEFPSQIIPHYTSRLIFNLRQNGLIPIVTHPERCAYFAKDFTGLKVLREQGCMFQLTAMSLLKDVAKEVRKNTLAMIEKGFADFIASDGSQHGPQGTDPLEGIRRGSTSVRQGSRRENILQKPSEDPRLSNGIKCSH